MAFTVFPLILWGINVILSSTPAARYQNSLNFGLLKKINHSYGYRFDIRRISALIKQTLQDFKPKVVRMATKDKGASFDDIFDGNSQTYVELYLYLDDQLSARKKLHHMNGDSISNLYHSERRAIGDPSLGTPDPSQPDGIREQGGRSAELNTLGSGHWEIVSFPPDLKSSDIENMSFPAMLPENEDRFSEPEMFFDYPELADD
jgi:hypothetical protein